MYKRINLTHKSKPVRKTGLLITQDDEGTDIRFPEKVVNYRLNKSATLIWQLCNGTQNFSEICQSIAQLSGESLESIESDTSDVIASLISMGLVEFNQPVPNPVIRIAFLDAPENFNKLNNLFLNLFVNWFDLLLVEADANPEFVVSWKSSNSGSSENTAVLCLVDYHCLENEGHWDIVFRHADCRDETGAIILHLPPDYIESSIHPLSETDRNSLNSLFERAPAKSMESKEKENLQVRKKLTIGMATFDDYDGVYFSVMAIRMFHPEVMDETEILVIDNNPGGPCSRSLRSLANSVSGYRYVANDEVKGTSVRDFVFHEAQTDYVMCIDSHVFIESGAIRKLIDYFDSHPRIPDLLQGPLVSDNLNDLATHFEPVWRQGMFGIWGCDDRGKDPEAEPFEIPMQGLGLAACRKDAWPGYNRRFSGFGGEEGYIHQKFRNAGARTLCLPFLRWVHRFERPKGTGYKNVWKDRIRNYLIGFEEVGLDTRPVFEHFKQTIDEDAVRCVVKQIELEKDNPFDFFDAIYCINLDSQIQRWQEVESCFQALGIAHRVRRFSAIETPGSHHIGCTLSHRKLVQEAKARGFENILVFEDDVIFHKDALFHLQNSLEELENQRWYVFYLGGMKWMKPGKEPFEKVQGCRYLERPKSMTCTHAVAYHSTFYDTLLEEVPATVEGVEEWINVKYPAIDQYLPHINDLIVMTPVIASQPSILADEEESMRDGFHA